MKFYINWQLNMDTEIEVTSQAAPHVIQKAVKFR